MSDENATNERPLQERRGLISAECRDGQHGIHCSRNPRSPVASMGYPVCACACHDVTCYTLPERLERPESEGNQ